MRLFKGSRGEEPSAVWPRLLAFGASALVLSMIAVRPGMAPTTETKTVATQRSASGQETPGVQPSVSGEQPVLAPPPPNLECAPGRNGGATDVGVTADSIKLGATVVESGVGASFLSDVRYAMLAVVNKVNRNGGICGRRLDLKLVDDGWDFQRGGDYLRNLVEQDKVFALTVVPSSEGLKNVSDSGYLQRKKVPVVGSDGMLIHQYTDPTIWPVAASTVSAMHIMAKHAYDAGARRFGIIYERTYHFGLEGAYAFNQAVRRLTKKDIPGYSNPLTRPSCREQFCGIEAGASSYNSEIQTFNSSCLTYPEPPCDFVALLLEPTTALAWLKGGGASSRDLRMGAPQPLFNRPFSVTCGGACEGLQVWTGFYPPTGRYLGRKAVSTYVSDISSTNTKADYANTFVQGAYIGMSLTVRALQEVGPYLTRDRLRATLNHITFDSGLTDPLRWRPDNHFANVTMRAFTVQYKSGFIGWRDDQVAVRDPWVGLDTGH